MKDAINKRDLAGLLAGAAVIAVVVCIACFVSVMHGNAIAKTETDRYLAELAEQTKYKVEQRLTSNQELLSLLSSELGTAESNPEGEAAFTASFLEMSPFEWVGTVDASGELSVGGQPSKNIICYPTVEHAIAGKAGVSDALVSVFDDEYGALYAVPASDADSSASAVVGWVPPDKMRLLLNTDTADGIGFSHIVAANGDFILRSSNEHAFLRGDNVFSSLAEQVEFTSGSLAELKSAVANGESGHVRFIVGGELREMSYTPLSSGDWYLLSIVPPDLYTSPLTSYITSSVASIAAIAFLLFVVLGVVVLRMMGKKNREIMRIAYEDPVTGGFTSTRFDQLMKKRLDQGKSFSFVSIDVKSFKLINDFFGKDKGDAILKHIHDTIAKSLAENEFVARVSSDVFNVAVDDTDPDRIASWLDLIAQEVNSFDHAGKAYLLTLRCGIYLVKEAEDIVSIRDHANTARKSADGKPGQLLRYAFFSDPEHRQIMLEKEMENAMDSALENGEFVVYLQPKVSLETEKTIGAEALVRWDSPERGLIPPDAFIPFFERNGFVVKLDLHVFEQVCRLIRAWMDAGITPLPISVNLSPMHLQIHGFLDDFEEVRRRYDVPAELLELELTERVAFENLDLLRHVVDEIHDHGFLCSMDDFGSGYSSLNVLKDIPVDVLKIDRVFFNNSSSRARDVVASVVDLAKKLDMRTVAEGVETIPQVEILRSMRCDAVQGYVFSAPVPVETFEKMTFDRGGEA